jgi:hypothetical protein
MDESGQLTQRMGGAPTSLGRSTGSDRELMRPAIGGSSSAAEALVARHWDRAYRIAFAIIGDAHCAEDITQEAMVSLLGSVGRSTSTARSSPGCIGSSRIALSTGHARDRDVTR